MFRSYLAMQQFDIVLDEITDSPNTPVGKNKKPIVFWCCFVLIVTLFSSSCDPYFGHIPFQNLPL